MTVSSTSSTTSSGTSTVNPFAGSTTSTSGGPPITFNGVISGMNTKSIIAALMAAYKQPQINITNQISQINSNISNYETIQSQLSSLQTAADAINQTYLWDATSASSSNSSVATATSTSGAPSGTLSFSVNQLAQGAVEMSNSSVGSTSSIVATAPLLIATGAGNLGFASLTAGTGLAIGSHSIDVTSALSGASVTGTSVSSSTTITTGSNDTVTANVNGTAQTFTIAAGTYSQSQLASALASASGGLLNVSAAQNGGLAVSTTQLGSSSSLQITGGNALSSLGLTAAASAVNGTAGSITVDGTVNTVNNVAAGSSVTLNSGTGGTIATTVGTTGFSTGSFTANYLNIGGGTLSDLVSSINGAGIGISASAVNLGTNSYVLELASTSTGTASQITLDNSALSSSLGGMKQVVAGQDAQIQIGGSSGYTVNSATNAVTGVMQGVTLNLVSAQAAGSTPVSVSITPNATAMASSVSNLVSAANTALSTINKLAGYNSSTSTAGPLMADPNMTTLTQAILQTVASATGPAGAYNSAAVGLSLTKTGTITFDQNTFISAYNANPSAVASIFSQGGNFQSSSATYNGAVSLVYGADATVPGTYAVNISQSATQAKDSGNVISTGTITSAENLTITSGTASASYSATAGESLSAIATGLNSALSAQGIGVNASVVTNGSGSQLILNSGAYGSAASFSVTSSAVGAGQTGLASVANTPTTFSGLDVAGTINGVTATGSGQILTAPATDPTLAGMALSVTASGITSSTNIGSFSYTPGIAGGMAYAGNLGSNAVNGMTTTTIASLNSQASALQFQYSSYTPMINAEQQLLTQEFSNMEVQLGTLQNQTQWLTSAIAKLP